MGLFSQNAPPQPGAPAAGRRPTLAELYAAHFPGVVRSVRFFGVPDRDAKDVAQDVFVRVHTALPSYDPSRKVGAWLHTIAYRTACDHLRSAYSRRVRLETDDEKEVADTAQTPEGHALLEQMQRIFVEVLQEIDEDQRTAYLMSVKDEIPIPEIAELLGVPENTVRSRVHRARRAIEAAVARRQTKAGSVLAPLLVPAALVDAARKGFHVDPDVQAVVWSRLSRLLGIGIVGALAPASGAVIAGGAALLFALGAGSGALLHATVVRPRVTETPARAESVATASPPAPPSASPSATASTSATPPAAPTASATVSVAGPDAGAPDAAAILRAEQSILARAREAMDREDWQTALRELQRHARNFPHGMLAAQREQMRQVVMEALTARDGGPR